MITYSEAFELAATYQLEMTGVADLYNPRETDEFWIFSRGTSGVKVVGGSQVIVSKEDGMVSPLILPPKKGIQLHKDAKPAKVESAWFIPIWCA